MQAKDVKVITYVDHTRCRLHLHHQSAICESLPLSRRAHVVCVTFDQTSPLKKVIKMLQATIKSCKFQLAHNYINNNTFS
jgi:hypothetical protein